MSPTAVRRKTATDPVADFTQHIVLKREASTLSTRANKIKDSLKKWFLESPTDEVYENENGSKFLDFPEVISDGKETYIGMELRRSAPVKFHEDVAERILKKKGVYEEALVQVLDQDKIYALQQEGKITEADLDKMFVAGEQWAFWPVKGDA